MNVAPNVALCFSVLLFICLSVLVHLCLLEVILFFQGHFVSFWATESKKWIGHGIGWDGHHRPMVFFGANKSQNWRKIVKVHSSSGIAVGG